MLFRQLEYFVALARERHFARAAQACHVSQPALSEAIRKLEHELKVPLVRRGHRFDGLTPEGERLVRWARRILADHDSLKQEVAALKDGLTGQLRLGVIPAATSTATLLTDPLCTAHPLVRVRLDTRLGSGELLERLRRLELDAAIVHPPENPGAELEVLHLYDERLVLIAGTALLAGRKDPPEWQDLLDLPMCLLDKGMRSRELFDDALSRRGMEVTPRLETDSLVALVSHVATGRWVSVLPEVWARSLAWPAGVATVPLDDLPVEAPVALVLPSADPLPLLAGELVSIARRIATPRLDEAVTADAVAPAAGAGVRG
ncbi:LysR family transcriptional regulator [Pseudonocardia phyllosphaerae]|uniref:LysR family transcriptional regulator n=1 Tax=Pseudonocardia phyllosphaerae TaxID=3390502 RepID=UPI00397AED6E